METRPYMVLELIEAESATNRAGIRPVTDDDLWAMAGVMADAYRGTIDDEGEDQPAALHELESTANGAYGPALRDAWLLHETDGDISAAVICTRWHELPFIAQTFTHPNRQRNGISGRLVLAVAEELRRLGETQLSLIVTRRNPAYELYLRLGFQERPWPEDA